jgi:WD40 repeat protein
VNSVNSVLHSGKSRGNQQLSNRPSAARRSLGFTPDKRRLCTSSLLDHTLSMHDVKTGERTTLFGGSGNVQNGNGNENRSGGHTDMVHSVRFSSDGGAMCTASRDQTIRIWETKTGTCLTTLECGEVEVTAMSPSELLSY